ncbi:MAG: hypothetical protein H6834_08860 [Planctomycetes bacterium]|nr:hypothetical protein [Planctomycetota bacterium]
MDARTFLPLIALLGLAAPVTAQDKTKKDPFVVVETSGEFQTMKKSEVAEYKKRVEAEYKEAVKAHDEAKKEAAKKKEKFTQPKPAKPAVKAHGGTFETEQEAADYIQKVKSKGKRESKNDTPPPPKRRTPPPKKRGGRDA